MYLGIGKVATMIGVSISTLQRWDNDNLLSASYRTAGGHRRYKLIKILMFCKNIKTNIPDFNQVQQSLVRVAKPELALKIKILLQSKSLNAINTLFKSCINNFTLLFEYIINKEEEFKSNNNELSFFNKNGPFNQRFIEFKDNYL